MTSVDQNRTFPADKLKAAEVAIRKAHALLGSARDWLSDALDPSCTALGAPDRVKLEKAKEATNSTRDALEDGLRGIDHIRRSGGCGPTSDTARARG